MATLIPAVGDPRPIEPAHPPAFTLQELHALVGGYIEVVYTRLRIADPDVALVLVINADSKRLQLPVNGFATHLVRDDIRPDDVINGDAVVCTLIEMGETDDELDDDGT